MNSPTYTGFSTWEEVLAYVREHGVAYYQAPLNHRPVCVKAEVRGHVVRMMPEDEQWVQPGTGRVIPQPQDPFDADSSHLDRFRRGPGEEA